MHERRVRVIFYVVSNVPRFGFLPYFEDHPILRLPLLCFDTIVLTEEVSPSRREEGRCKKTIQRKTKRGWGPGGLRFRSASVCVAHYVVRRATYGALAAHARTPAGIRIAVAYISLHPHYDRPRECAPTPPSGPPLCSRACPHHGHGFDFFVALELLHSAAAVLLCASIRRDRMVSWRECTLQLLRRRVQQLPVEWCVRRGPSSAHLEHHGKDPQSSHAHSKWECVAACVRESSAARLPSFAR